MVQIETPSLANKELKFWGYNGAKADTIQKVTLDALGKASLNFPQIKSAKIINFSIQKTEPIKLIFTPNEQIIIRCLEKECTAQNIFIENSTSNRQVADWFAKSLLLKKRKFYLENMTPLYPDNDSFKSALMDQMRRVELEYTQFNNSFANDTSFVANYYKLKQISDKITINFVKQNEENKTIARNYFINDINFDAMYRSDVWFSIINNTLGTYFEKSPYFEKFGEDVISNLKKTKSQEAFNALAEDALFICNKVAWLVDKEKIENFLITSNRVSAIKLKELKQIQQLHIGKKAPDVIIQKLKEKPSILKSGELSKMYTLLLFHETGCGHCDIEIEKIVKDYDFFNKKGIRLISFSSDISEEIYIEKAKNFPWKDHYCSYNGMQDQNFKNYIVTGTPTFYLLDSKGIILSKGYNYESVISFFLQK